MYQTDTGACLSFGKLLVGGMQRTLCVWKAYASYNLKQSLSLSLPSSAKVVLCYTDVLQFNTWGPIGYMTAPPSSGPSKPGRATILLPWCSFVALWRGI